MSLTEATKKPNPYEEKKSKFISEESSRIMYELDVRGIPNTFRWGESHSAIKRNKKGEPIEVKGKSLYIEIPNRKNVVYRIRVSDHIHPSHPDITVDKDGVDFGDLYYTKSDFKKQFNANLISQWIEDHTEEYRNLNLQEAYWKLPNFNTSINGSCMYAVELIIPQLLQKDLEFVVIEGYITFPTVDWEESHTWIELKDGSIIDPTLDQWKIKDPIYIQSRQARYTPGAYLDLCNEYPTSDKIKQKVKKESLWIDTRITLRLQEEV